MSDQKCKRCDGDGVDPSILDMDFYSHDWGVPTCGRCDGSGKEPKELGNELCP